MEYGRWKTHFETTQKQIAEVIEKLKYNIESLKEIYLEIPSDKLKGKIQGFEEFLEWIEEETEVMICKNPECDFGDSKREVLKKYHKCVPIDIHRLWMEGRD